MGKAKRKCRKREWEKRYNVKKDGEIMRNGDLIEEIRKAGR